jgi:HSP20 family protein
MLPKNLSPRHSFSNPKTNSSDFFLSPQAIDHYESDINLFSSEGQLSCDVYQDKNNIIIRATMAGVDPKNLDIAVANDLLTIRGFRELDETIRDDDFYSREIYWGSFSRSIVLPQQVDQAKVRATLKNGVLTIILPKKYKTSSIKVRSLSE